MVDILRARRWVRENGAIRQWKMGEKSAVLNCLPSKQQQTSLPCCCCRGCRYSHQWQVAHFSPLQFFKNYKAKIDVWFNQWLVVQQCFVQNLLNEVILMFTYWQHGTSCYFWGKTKYVYKHLEKQNFYLTFW